MLLVGLSGCLAGILLWPAEGQVAFKLATVALILVYGVRVRRLLSTALLITVVLGIGMFVGVDLLEGTLSGVDVLELPLMATLFITMVSQARSRQAALDKLALKAGEDAALVDRQERFLQDVSHGLRTPITIARGHLELARPLAPGAGSEIQVALEELARVERTLSRLVRLAKASRPDFVSLTAIDLEPFVEDVFLRWSDIAPRVWRLGDVPGGTLIGDQEALRTALDALIENAVKHTEPHHRIELRARVVARGGVELEVEDDGAQIPREMLDRIFDRFARVDLGVSEPIDGAGLGLAIVDAIVRAHGGTCAVTALPNGCAFTVRLPRFNAAATQPRAGTRIPSRA